jgi:hypothetical protein
MNNLLAQRAVNPPPSSSLAEERRPCPLLAPLARLPLCASLAPCGGARSPCLLLRFAQRGSRY